MNGMNKIGIVLGEYKRGGLHMGRTGRVVPKNRPDIAKAIALSEARKSGADIPFRREVARRAS